MMKRFYVGPSIYVLDMRALSNYAVNIGGGQSGEEPEEGDARQQSFQSSLWEDSKTSKKMWEE